MNLFPGCVLGRCRVQPEPAARSLTHRPCMRYHHYSEIRVVDKSDYDSYRYVKITTSGDSNNASLILENTPSNSFTDKAMGPLTVVDIQSSQQEALQKENPGGRRGSPEGDSDSSELEYDMDASCIPPRPITKDDCQSKIKPGLRRT
ncbi:hypothetical protein EVAR_27034_1 [Eumeta japonica]|uniref:Uncharacterized protein n=1 Tax=Eumeta variegata TaxID=151549 RepID=A0A4C1WFP8_EUMVA|nr:hypothetical protein EVAR_27034_1 [Eumeta japonica]